MVERPIDNRKVTGSSPVFPIDFKNNFSQQRGEQQKKGKAVLGITGSIDGGKKSPFSLDKNRVGGSPPSEKCQGKTF